MAEARRMTETDSPAGNAPAGSGPVVVKKYANRRLYNTEASSYVTLDHLAQLVKEGREFVVYDAKSGEDITRQVLTQIIVEEEGKGRNLLPIGFLRQLISFYDDSLQALVPRYLEMTMGAFARQQEQMRRAMQQTMEGLFPFTMEEVGRQNAAMLERAFAWFTPFYRPTTRAEEEGEDRDAELARLREEVQQLKTALAALEKERAGG